MRTKRRPSTATAVRRWPALLVGVLAVVACAEEPESPSAAEVVAPETTAAPPATTSTVPPSTAPVDVRSEQLASCVEHAKFQAFTGNAFWSSMWQDAGETDVGMRDVCVFLADGNDPWLAAIHDDWQALQAITEPVAPTSSITGPVAATSVAHGAPDASLVQACVDWVSWFVAAGEPDVVVAWGELATSATRLRAACTELAADSPERAQEMRGEVEDVVRFLDEPQPLAPPPARSTDHGCHPSYMPCVPLASDVDCAGGRGNGPAYTGRVTVIGWDEYGLDGDGDGVGCE